HTPSRARFRLARAAPSALPDPVHLDEDNAFAADIMHSQRHSAARDLVVSRLGDLGRFLDGPPPDVSVGVSERALGGVQARGYRWSALDRDRGAPALVEVPDRVDAVATACRSASSVSAGMAISGSSPCACSAVIRDAFSRSRARITAQGVTRPLQEIAHGRASGRRCSVRTLNSRFTGRYGPAPPLPD